MRRRRSGSTVHLATRRTAPVLVALAALAAPARAGLIQVAAGESIQAAIDQAAPGDEILVMPGTYEETIDLGGKAVWLHSFGGAAVTIIDAGGMSSVVTCDDEEGPDTIIEGFTLTRGSGSVGERGITGGGAFCVGSSPVFRGCVFEDNDATFGGGLWADGGAPRIESCAFRHNTAQIGGGLRLWDSNAVILASTIEQSSAQGGAGLFAENGVVLVDGCLFRANNALAFAGLGSNGSDITVSRCRFIENVATLGVSAAGTARNGGPGDGTFVSCAFLRNEAIGDADSVTLYTTGDVVNCTIYGNIGFGVAGKAVMRNCIIWANSLGPWQGATYMPAPAAATHCLVAGLSGEGNVDAAPQLVDPDAYDLRPLAGSPALDAGSTDALPPDRHDLDGDGDVEEPLPLDLAGQSRVEGSSVDIGAYEGGVTPPSPPGGGSSRCPRRARPAQWSRREPV